MTDPNSSLLAQFDPIRNSHVSDTTPARSVTSKSDDALTLSTFFNRINIEQPAPPILPPPNNRGSLIDFSFNFEDLKVAALETTPAKHCHEQSTHAHQHTENVPPKPVRASPRKQRDARAPISPSKHSRVVDTPRESVHGRRSSLDLSTLTLDIKQRLAAENMSFDILRDEVSFLTNMAEEETPAIMPRAARSEGKVKAVAST